MDKFQGTWNGKIGPKEVSLNVDIYSGIKSDNCIGWLSIVHPSQHEHFHPRLLQHEFRGTAYFQTLKSVDGYVCETCREIHTKYTEKVNAIWLHYLHLYSFMKIHMHFTLIIIYNIYAINIFRFCSQLSGYTMSLLNPQN